LKAAVLFGQSCFRDRWALPAPVCLLQTLAAHFLKTRAACSFRRAVGCATCHTEVSLYLRNRRLLFLHFAMLFQELIEQHRVHRIVADRVRFPLLIVHDQRRIHFLRSEFNEL
jgi:hypothetical protein